MDNKTRAKIITSLISEEEKMKFFNLTSDVFQKIEIIKSLRGAKYDDEKLRLINEIRDNTKIKNMISSINCEKKDLFDYYMMNGIDVSIWVLSANDLDNKGKIEMLSWKSYASLMNSIIVTMHLSKNKLKAIEGIESEWWKVEIVKTLRSDKKKLELLSKLNNIYYKLEIINSLSIKLKKQMYEEMQEEIQKVVQAKVSRAVELYNKIYYEIFKYDLNKKYINLTSLVEIIELSETFSTKYKIIKAYTKKYAKSDKKKLELFHFLIEKNGNEDFVELLFNNLNDGRDKVKFIKEFFGKMPDYPIKETVKSLKSDKKKIELLSLLNERLSEKNKEDIISSLESDEEKLRLLKELNLLGNESDSEYLKVICSLKADEEKLKLLEKLKMMGKESYFEYTNIMVSIKSDEEKLKLLEEKNQKEGNLYGYERVISSLKSDEEKLKLLERIIQRKGYSHSYNEVISSLKSEEEKLKCIDRPIYKLIPSQKIELVKSLKIKKEEGIKKLINFLEADKHNFYFYGPEVIMYLQSDNEKIVLLEKMRNSEGVPIEDPFFQNRIYEDIKSLESEENRVLLADMYDGIGADILKSDKEKIRIIRKYDENINNSKSMSSQELIDSFELTESELLEHIKKLNSWLNGK